MTQDELSGQLLAIQAAIRALLLAHPDRPLALKAFESQMEIITAKALGKAISEDFLTGVATARKMMRPRLRASI